MQNEHLNLKQQGWNGHQLGDERFKQIREGILALKDLCACHNGEEEPEDVMLLDTIEQVLESLERKFLRHFEMKSGHIVSPKSIEPWD